MNWTAVQEIVNEQKDNLIQLGKCTHLTFIQFPFFKTPAFEIFLLNFEIRSQELFAVLEK